MHMSTSICLIISTIYNYFLSNFTEFYFKDRSIVSFTNVRFAIKKVLESFKVLSCYLPSPVTETSSYVQQWSWSWQQTHEGVRVLISRAVYGSKAESGAVICRLSSRAPHEPSARAQSVFLCHHDSVTSLRHLTPVSDQSASQTESHSNKQSLPIGRR